MSTEEENKALVRRFVEEVWGKGDLALEQQVLAPDFVDHNSWYPTDSGPTGHRLAVEMYRRAIPDLSVKVDLLLADGDFVTDRWVATGTQTGELMGVPPSNKSFTVTGIDIWRIENGKLKELWHQEDMMGFMRQIGAIPARGQEQRRAA